MAVEILFWVTNFKRLGPGFSKSRIQFWSTTGSGPRPALVHNRLWCPRPDLIHDQLWSATGSDKG